MSKVILANYTRDALDEIYKAYRVCYSEKPQDEIEIPLNEDFTPDTETMSKFINKYIKLGHQSPLEHVSLTFYLEGVSRVLTHQLVRHRLSSYSQQSQRYVNGLKFDYVIPPEIEKNEDAKKIYLEYMENDMKGYTSLVDKLLTTYLINKLEELNENINDDDWYTHDDLHKYFLGKYKSVYKELEKKAFEDARYILPNATTTNITVTMNGRQYRHFIGERACQKAQWEIREVAFEMINLVNGVIPILNDNVLKCSNCLESCRNKQ